ncbi:AT-hook motif nuclear-localized protein 1 isoform X1 [Physcomitrium patens]|uniref:AT-hook motif nuclear-localized protein n=1 Tax=Physcomitrium patens TaxID=3218 RepID=A0A2K1JUG8_PHYPA|nr:AT-hook motif nuclear-localized protein 7-like isoform X2 [Physcomitrium patens]PNR45175.1 hypothetical protein PHYPA_014946 [Physcomitrium patens]|eukprot:XP_024389276.1 AT-hook motif nuclear-localized protein 7-like isoform X2 [Physcomitrella patens]
MNSSQPPAEGTRPAPASAPAPVLPMPSALVMSMGMALGGVSSRGETVKRKRGRPRKYVGNEPGGAASAAGGTPVNMQLALHTPNSGPSGSPFTPTGVKRGRGRPLGSSRKLHQLVSFPSAGSWAGQNFTPHIITIAAGEDIAAKIYSFAQHGPRAVCVMSANGAISTAILRQQSSSGGNVTYEGRYEILSLMGSFLPTEQGANSRQRTGGLSVSLACSDGRVIGGGVAGVLTAASPIQVVVGSFIFEPEKAAVKVGNGQQPSMGYSLGADFSAALTPASAPRPLKTSPVSATPASTPAHQQAVTPPSHPSSGQSSQQLFHQSMGLFQQPMPWSNPPLAEARRTDINISLPGG